MEVLERRRRTGVYVDLIIQAAGRAGNEKKEKRATSAREKGQNPHLYSTMWCMFKNKLWSPGLRRCRNINAQQNQSQLPREIGFPRVGWDRRRLSSLLEMLSGGSCQFHSQRNASKGLWCQQETYVVFTFNCLARRAVIGDHGVHYTKPVTLRLLQHIIFIFQWWKSSHGEEQMTGYMMCYDWM